MSWTTPRVKRNTIIAAAHQASFAAGASTSGSLVRAQCYESEIDRGEVAIDPQGTTGSEFPRDTRTIVATRPKASLRFYATSRALLALILEHATHGQPTATLAGSDLTETGESGGVLSAWSLTGIRPGFNTSSGFLIYAKLEDETPGAGQARISLYSDSARTALVAQGSAANGGTAALAEQNASGLSGTVVLGTVTASNLTSIYLTIARIHTARAPTVARYFTLWRETGGELETITGCTIERLRFRSREEGPVLVEADIIGGAYAKSASTLTPAAVTLEPLAHQGATLSYAATSYNALELVHGIEHDIAQDLANAAAPVTIWKRSSKLLPIEIRQRLSAESMAFVDDGAAGTWREVVISYIYGAKSLVITYPRAVVAAAGIPRTDEKGFEDHVHMLEARDDGSNDPVTISLQL